MLINLRNALMTGKRLPYDAEVEFIQSDGQAFVNTGFVVEEGSKITCNIGMASSYGSTYGYFGASDGTGSYLGGGFNCTSPFKDRRLSVWVKNKLWWCSTARATDIYQDGALHSMSIDLSSSSPSVSFDSQGISYASGYTSGVAAMPSIPLYLFAVNSAGTAKIVPASAALKIGSFRVDKNGETKLDIIAVRKGTVGYLYDRVSGKLFGNAGTGDFVLGPDVVPVEYIKGTGTQYIDTGVYQQSDTEYVATLMPESSGNCAIGNQGGGGAYGYRLSFHAAGVFQDWYSSRVSLAAQNFNVVYTATVRRGYLNVKSADGSVDLTATGSQTSTTTSTMPMYVFTAGPSSSGAMGAIRFYSLKILNGTTIVRDYKAIRVGTEGAMMDVLTRRIYRNAGTGAFTYGNDLKYPIPAE